VVGIGGVDYDASKLNSKDVGAGGILQTDLTTIELGFAPFIPLSKMYHQMTTFSQSDRPFTPPAGVRAPLMLNGKASLPSTPVSFKWMPVEGAEDEDWLSELRAWEDANFSLSEVVDKAGSGNLAAANLSRALTAILEGKGVKNNYSTTVKGELAEQALIANLMQDMQPGGQAYSKTLDARHRQITQQLGGKYSQETFDLVSQNDNEQDALEHSLHSIASLTQDEDFVKDVRAIETTNMRTSKFFQNLAIQKSTSTYATAEQHRLAVTEGIKLINNTIKTYGNDIQKSFKALDTGLKLPKKDSSSLGAKADMGRGTYDSQNYMGRQILDRVYRLMNDWIVGAEAGDVPLAGAPAYIFQEPLNENTVAYITLWGTGTPTNLGEIGADVRYISTDLSKYVDPNGNPIDWLEDHFDVMPEAGKNYLGLHYNVMLIDAVVNRGLAQNDIERLSTRINLDYANSMASNTGQRVGMVGSSMSTEVYNHMSSAISNNTVVSAVEILSSQEMATVLQQQVLNYFSDPSVKSTMAKIYEQATDDSKHITNQWKNQFSGAKSGNSPFGPPYLGRGSSDLTKVGMPFWLTMGRDPFAYKAFGTQVKAKTAKDFQKKGMWDPRNRYISRVGTALPATRSDLIPFGYGSPTTQRRSMGIAFQPHLR
tara:strand:- start:1184 stop:3142 length:1959 start_codon:yes stop_codon:yes gene_type:complete